ncbi:MAG: FapA family protein [Phycisphaerales bacterium JB060]
MPDNDFQSKCHVSVSPDGLAATVRIEAGAPRDAEEAAQTVLSVLAGQGIDQGRVVEGAIEELIGCLASSPETDAEGVVARGVAPMHGTDGWFEPSLMPSTPAMPDDNDQKPGAIDHYAQSSIVVVRKGQRVGVLHSEGEPVAGIDVYGSPIEAAPGRPCAVVFDATVELRDDGAVMALHDGCLKISDTQVSVESTLVIEDSIDFATGNVDFPGNVVVRAGVRDRFSVRVGGDLEVAELVEAASIRTSGSARLSRGMAGRGKGVLDVGQDLHAGYLDGATVRVGGDLCVQNELSSCVTLVGRRVQSPECAVVSGELSFRFGGHVRTIGSEAETEVIVRAGCDPDLDAQTRLLEEALSETVRRLEKARADLTDASGEAGASIGAEVARLEAKGPAIRTALERVLSAYERMAGVTLHVERSVMPGVTLHFGAQGATVRQAISGPVEILVDESGGIVYRSGGTTTPLATRASMHAARGATDLDELRRWLEHPLLRSSEKAA